MRFDWTHVKNTWYNYKASKTKQRITKAKINKRSIASNAFNCKQSVLASNMEIYPKLLHLYIPIYYIRGSPQRYVDYIISCLTQWTYTWRCNTIRTYRFCVSLALSTFWRWLHNQLLMTSQVHYVTRHMWQVLAIKNSDSLNISFIHGHIHSWSSEKVFSKCCSLNIAEIRHIVLTELTCSTAWHNHLIDKVNFIR